MWKERKEKAKKTVFEKDRAMVLREGISELEEKLASVNYALCDFGKHLTKSDHSFVQEGVWKAVSFASGAVCELALLQNRIMDMYEGVEWRSVPDGSFVVDKDLKPHVLELEKQTIRVLTLPSKVENELIRNKLYGLKNLITKDEEFLKLYLPELDAFDVELVKVRLSRYGLAFGMLERKIDWYMKHAEKIRIRG